MFTADVIALTLLGVGVVGVFGRIGWVLSKAPDGARMNESSRDGLVLVAAPVVAVLLFFFFARIAMPLLGVMLVSGVLGLAFSSAPETGEKVKVAARTAIFGGAIAGTAWFLYAQLVG